MPSRPRCSAWSANSGTRRKRRRRLAWQLAGLQEEERQRLARDLHDEMGQQLTALRVNAAWLSRQEAVPATCRQVADDMAHACERLQASVRAALADLRPLPALSGQGADSGTGLDDLARLLRSLVDDWQRAARAAPRASRSCSFEQQDATGRTVPWDPSVADLAADHVPLDLPDPARRR